MSICWSWLLFKATVHPNSASQTDATTFALSSNSILLLWSSASMTISKIPIWFYTFRLLNAGFPLVNHTYHVRWRKSESWASMFTINNILLLLATFELKTKTDLFDITSENLENICKWEFSSFLLQSLSGFFFCPEPANNKFLLYLDLQHWVKYAQRRTFFMYRSTTLCTLQIHLNF